MTGDEHLTPEPTAPPADLPSEMRALASGAYPQLHRAQRWSVRLVISIPVLLIAIVLASGATLYVYLDNLAEWSNLPAELKLTVGRAAVNVLLLSIPISVVAGIMGLIVAWQIVKPIKQLAHTMESIASGDFTMKVQPITLGEFGQLGNTFNRMVEQLNSLFEERDRQLRQSFGGTHLVLSREGVVLQADQAVKRILGLGAQEISGRNLLSPGGKIPILNRNPPLLDALSDMFADTLAGRTGFRSVSIRNEQGVYNARYMVSCLPLDSAENRPMQILVVIRDISGFESFYEQIQRADRLAAVGTLATGIAHEIRNPLASIRGMIQLMQEDEADEQVRHFADYHARMLREVDRLEKLVHGIMNFAQSEESPQEEVDINSLLRDVVDTSRMHVGEACENIAVEWELDEKLPRATLQVDRLRQAFGNIITNAFQHCAASGKGPIRIQTTHLNVNPKRPFIICISNPCEALSEAERERLLEPFFTTKVEGTGLGLPIAYQIIVANGGLLEIEWDEGELLFYIHLPKDQQAQRTASRIIPRMNTPIPVDLG